MKVFLFGSKSHPHARPYRTTLHDDGGVTCDCPARVECWHKKRVKAGEIIGRLETLSAHTSLRNILIIRSFADEGDIDSALSCTRACFPSMEPAEVYELYNEIVTLEMEEPHE